LLIDEAKKIILIAAAIIGGRDGLAKLKTYIQARLWVLRHATWLRLTRTRIQAERRVTDGEILQLMSGRLTMVNNAGGRFINFLALSYCRAAGLCTVEFRTTAAAKP